MDCDFNRLDYRILDVKPIDGVVLTQVILYYLSVSFQHNQNSFLSLSACTLYTTLYMAIMQAITFNIKSLTISVGLFYVIDSYAIKKVEGFVCSRSLSLLKNLINRLSLVTTSVDCFRAKGFIQPLMKWKHTHVEWIPHFLFAQGSRKRKFLPAMGTAKRRN